MFLKIKFIFHELIFIFCLHLLLLAQNNTETRYTFIRNNNDNCRNSSTTVNLDQLFARLYTFGESGREFPLNLEQSLIYCSETQELLNTAERYAKSCLKEYPKQLISILIHTVRTQSKTLCTNKGSKRLQDLFTSANCTNAAKSQYQKCINESVDIMMATVTVDDKQKLSILCCGSQKMRNCFHDEAIKVSSCTEEKVEKSLRFLDSVQGNMLSFLCSKFDDTSDICDHIVYPNKSQKTKRNKSFVMSLINVLDSVKD